MRKITQRQYLKALPAFSTTGHRSHPIFRRNCHALYDRIWYVVPNMARRNHIYLVMLWGYLVIFLHGLVRVTKKPCLRL
jgi:hypothetical protein